MTDHSALLRPAAAEFLRVARLPALTAPTPCAGYDVRGLLNHLLYWGPWLAAAGRREPYRHDVTEADSALVTDGWFTTLEKQTEALVDAFSAPGAWDGMATLGSATMPAAVVGDMVLGEFVLHGWDLARAAGVPLTCPDETAEAVRASAVAMGEQARAMGVYGPEVPVPADAPALERALGATGRDPRQLR
ncbi:TIGR03086 family metal-binding protein [Amycolatopsis rhabdoformis]|uniref:TIGR03086 family metal-binding protein n=1 Tax=Amycolatopsis rhabdoformis TaxID=1448059 RepID=A0ABZ1I254_9PSEU|nr:TIGR03086 family metal-binding protein [Amycolatopsis rhabdoformis]WSE27730.1 TIGR03086 family metal-binding protein [Amycolatopsis rhabdoformis]